MLYKDKTALDASIVGTWSLEMEGVAVITFTFNAEGTGKMVAGGTEASFSYIANGGKLTISMIYDDEIAEYTYKVNGNQLTLKESNGEETIFTRTEPKSHKEELISSTGSLVGVWITQFANSTMTFTFNPDGSCINEKGEKARYKTSAGKVTIYDSKESVTFDYRVNANTLILTMEGVKVTFTRK